MDLKCKFKLLECEEKIGIKKDNGQEVKRVNAN